MYSNCNNNYILDFTCDDDKKNFIKKIKNKNIFIETIFANNLKEIIINKNEYTFNIDFISSDGCCNNWCFEYKPGKRGKQRKRKSKNLIQIIDSTTDSGYETETSKNL